MKASKHIHALVSRWPKEGLPHGYERTAGEPWDIRRSKLLTWLFDQPEFWQWVFDYIVSRGWIEFRDGAWHAGDPDLTRREKSAARAGKEGSGKAAKAKLPAADLIAALAGLGGRAKWEDWRQAAQARTGARVGKLWGFYHAIKPLLASGRVRKANGGFYQLEAPAADMPADTDPESFIVACIRAAAGQPALFGGDSAESMISKWAALGRDPDEIMIARAEMSRDGRIVMGKRADGQAGWLLAGAQAQTPAQDSDVVDV